MPHARRAISSLVLIALFASGCSRGSDPAEELRGIIEVLGNPTVSPARFGDELYAVLDDASRTAIDARAKAISERLGAKVGPDEILQPRGIASAARVSLIEVVSRDEDRATLEVSFAPIVFIAAAPAADALPGALGQERAGKPEVPTVSAPPVRLDVVKQLGRWRIAFRDLATLVSAMPVEASAAGAGP